MPELSTIYDYMRRHAALLGDRILQEYPALHQFEDAVSPRIEGLLRTPFPAQTIAIMGVAKRWQQARTSMVVAECGTGKTLISLGAIHVHSWRKSVYRLSDGSATPGRKVGARSVSDIARNTGVPDR